MHSIAKVFGNFKDYYLNSASPTMDIVVIEQPDGEFLSSPLHLNLDIERIANNMEYKMAIKINGSLKDLQLQYVKTGEACIIEEVDCPQKTPSPSDDSPNLNEISDHPPKNCLSLSKSKSSPSVNKFIRSDEKTLLKVIESSLLHFKFETNCLNDCSTGKTNVLRKCRSEGNITDLFHYNKSDSKLVLLSPIKSEDSFKVIPKKIDESQDKTDLEESCNDRKRSAVGWLLKALLEVMKVSMLTKRNQPIESEKNDNEESNSPVAEDDTKTLESIEQQEPKEKILEASSLDNKIHSSSELLSDTLDISDTDSCESATESYLKEEEEEEINVLYAKNNLETFQENDVFKEKFLLDTNAVMADIRLPLSTKNTKTSLHSFDETSLTCASDSFDEHRFLEGLECPDDSSKEFELLDKTVSESNFSRSEESPENSSTKDSEDFSLSETNANGDESLTLQSDLEITPNISVESFNQNDLSTNWTKYLAFSICECEENGGIDQSQFLMNLLSYKDLCQQPELFYSPKLVVRVDGECYPWSLAAPLITLNVILGKQPPLETLEKLKKFNPSGTYTGRSQTENSTKRSWWLWKSKSGSNGFPNKTFNELSDSEKKEEKDEISLQIKDSNKDLENSDLKNPCAELNDLALNNTPSKIELKPNYSYRKMLKFSSNVIKKLGLKEGKNLLEFSIVTQQGVFQYKCIIYLWKYYDKIVVSDIDGTITKSDLLGHILPMVGKDWSQWGVVPLFNKIVHNGYRILYLSSRAWNQIKPTREYLSWMRQDNVALPDGPILLSPDSILGTLHRELIEKKAELFKIACLQDIGSLFPNKNPFYAGFGNRLNDILAYKEVGILDSRIFTINHRGEVAFLTHSLRSSYLNILQIVDFIFSPIDSKDDCGDIQDYIQTFYWKDPIRDIQHEGKEISLQSSKSRSFRFPFTTKGNDLS